MQDLEALYGVIADIYTVPGNVDNWTGVLRAMAAHLGGRAAAYLLIDAGDMRTEIGGSYGFSDVHARAYEGLKGPAKDVRFKYMARLRPGEAMFDFEHVPDRAEYDANEWIRFERDTLGVYWYLVAQVSTHRMWYDIITVNRLEGAGPYDEKARGALQVMLPHLARVAELHRMVTRLEQRFGAVMAVLDRLLIGLVVLDTHGRVVTANQMAHQIAEASGALAMTREGRLRATRAEQDAQLVQRLQSTARTVLAEGRDAGGTVLLDGPGGGGRVLAEVVPLSDDGFVDGDKVRGSAVLLIDGKSGTPVSLGRLARIFGLTRAEEEVAQALVGGAETREVADDRNKSIETIRSQFKSALAKTGARSRLDLMRMAVKYSPPIDSAD